MENQALVVNRSVNYLIPYVKNPQNRAGGFIKGENAGDRGQNGLKARVDSEGKNGSESFQSGSEGGSSDGQISEAQKKKFSKLVSSQFDGSKRQFVSTLWAYLDLNTVQYLNDDRFNCFRLLFGPENLKRKLFSQTNPIEKRRRGKVLENVEHTDHNTLYKACHDFFQNHGLVPKVRKLPIDSSIETNGSNRRCSRIPGYALNYPSYHFISRQKRHLVEQVMRSKSFLETDFNRYSESRNYKSPFSLFEPHSKTISYLHDLIDDLNDPDFSGLYISLSTIPFKSNTELGRVRRRKLVAWCLIEVLASSEKCLKCIWVNPLISANGTTDILRAFIPFVILSSFAVKPTEGQLDKSDLFYAWLSDFDLFPRQALILLTSPFRFGFEKHYDCCEDTQKHTCSSISLHYPRFLSENNIEPLSNEHTDREFSEISLDSDDYMDMTFRGYLKEFGRFTVKGSKRCKCQERSNWNDLEQVLLACSEQMMTESIPRWLQIVKRSPSSYLEIDLQNVISSKFEDYESNYEIKIAEFTNLDNKHVQDLISSLYGNKWTHRFKLKYIKIFKTEEQHMLKAKVILNGHEPKHRRMTL